MGVISLQDIMEKKFHEIKNNFKRASVRNYISFDEDVFMDTYIKCYEHLKNTNMDEKQIIQYLWVSFINNIKKESKKNRYTIEKIGIEGAFNDDNIESIDEPYDDRRYKVYDYIISYVKENFNEDVFEAWYLHFTENKSYDDLIKLGFNNINFHNVFRNINNKIKTKLPKENKEYSNIIKEIFIKK